MYPIIYCCTYDVPYTLHAFIHKERCCRCFCSVCCFTAVVPPPAAAALRHRVPDGKVVAGSVNLIPSIVLFLFILKHDLFSMYAPIGSAVTFTASTCLYYTLGNYGHARSQGGRQSAAAKPPLHKYMHRYVGHIVSAIEKSDLDHVLSRKRPSSR